MYYGIGMNKKQSQLGSEIYLTVIAHMLTLEDHDNVQVCN